MEKADLRQALNGGKRPRVFVTGSDRFPTNPKMEWGWVEAYREAHGLFAVKVDGYKGTKWLYEASELQSSSDIRVNSLVATGTKSNTHAEAESF